MRKTKIVATLGPASETEEVIRELMLAGMNVARLNFSHGTYEEHQKKIDIIKKVRKELGLPVAIMLDTKGPEYRIKTFENGGIVLKEGDKFVFTTEDIIGNQERVSVSYKNLHNELRPGDTILLNNGLMTFTVEGISGCDIITRVAVGGELKNRKSMSFPGRLLKQVFLSEQDKSDILFGIKNEVDYIACSFVSTRQDLLDVQDFLKKNKGTDIELIAKIENQAGIDNVDEICKSCSGIMIGRGDMGVEIPFENLPAAQKKIITRCRLLGKRVITATEMLESMIYNQRPTRAEISDVANAVYDGTSAVMLSGETAAGKYPVEAVKTMAKIALATENNIDYRAKFYEDTFEINSTLDAISHSACAMAVDLKAKCIVACTISGETARMISRFRTQVDILGLTTKERNFHQLALSWGVTPALCEEYPTTDVVFYTARLAAIKTFSLSKNDKIVIAGGDKIGKSGTANLIKVVNV